MNALGVRRECCRNAFQDTLRTRETRAGHKIAVSDGHQR
jgi:DNA-directed RNA polymerase subunit N (RpoN/RPB10)